jgi:hypothetical protein
LADAFPEIPQRNIKYHKIPVKYHGLKKITTGTSERVFLAQYTQLQTSQMVAIDCAGVD